MTQNAQASQSKRQTRWLSQGLTDLWQRPEMGPQPCWDVVIVGSGYGGSVAAQSLANQCITENGKTRPLRVCLLERGKEYLPGAFPARFADLPGHVRVTRQGRAEPSGNRDGLFDLRLGPDVSTLLANGLGGGSLINAAVLARPDFNDTETGLPADVIRSLKGGYLDRATTLLGGGTADAPNRIDSYPGTTPDKSPVPKTGALRYFAGSNQGCNEFSLPQIAVSMSDKPNSAKVLQKQCTLCGDCLTGCNVDAKNSLDTNLLATAREGGVEIFTGASVLKLSRENAYWSVTVVHTDPRLQVRERGPLVLTVRRVIMAAGTLGSTEILLRSQSDTSVFSPLLGARFSCNGDNLAVIYDSPTVVDGVADEETVADDPGRSRKIGPTITSSVKMAYQSAQRPEFLIQEFSVPGPLKRFFSELVTTANTIYGLSDADNSRHDSSNAPAADPHAVDPAKIKNTLLVGLIGHDEAQGVISLAPQPDPPYGQAEYEGSVQICWPGLKNSALIEQTYQRLEELFKATSGGKSSTRLIANPMWRLLPTSLADLASLPRGPLLTVHPLGGCCMDTPTTKGVVNQYGQVHNAAKVRDEDDWFGSLVVLDGSIVPGSLGANPALTITALSLRAMDTLVPLWGLTRNTGAASSKLASPKERPRFVPHPMPAPASATPTEIKVVERLTGAMRLHIGETLPTDCVVELTLAYESKKVSDLTTVLKREIKVDPDNPLTRLRIYRASTWQQQGLEVASDEKRRKNVLYEFELSGTLRFFHRAASTQCGRRLRGLWAYARNRGGRDIWQRFPGKKTDATNNVGLSSLWEALCKAWTMASRAGEVRLFEYALTVGKETKSRPITIRPVSIAPGLAIKGNKRLTYNRRANPWQQLMELSITQMPGLCAQEPPVLKLDTRFLAKQGAPLLQIFKQQDQVQALAELTSFALVLARVVLSIHLWTFRKPDTPSRKKPDRLPGPIAGLPAPQVTPLAVDLIPKTTQAVIVRLTRYPRAHSEKPPLVMIHGYSVSGNTFTHPAIDCSAAEYFWRAGRDVWVVDLRTSSGMPTATHPWAMEDAALIDIPAALLHIKQVTGQNVDVLAHCIGAVMLSMALLSDAKKICSGQTQLGVDSWLTPRQLGILASFNERAKPDDPHPCIRQIVLSQKGPLLRYSDANIFRSYVMGFLRRALVGPGYQFRAAAKPTVTDQLLDRLLASLPYPPGDYDKENPCAPWKTTPWVGSRHRMDALYARDFSAGNLNDATLNAIDDLFGPINVDTVAQTMHFARFCRATNQRGRGEFVTLGNLRARWGGIPTLAIHGAENGLVDVSTQTLLDINFTAAGVPFTYKTHSGLGHQDALIGKSSAVVFDDIEAFLNHPPVSSSTSAGDLDRWFFDVPWIGPRLRVPLVGDTFEPSIACMSSPAFGESTLMLIPVDLAMRRVPAVPPYVTGDTGDSGAWLFVQPKADPTIYGWIAVIAYRASEITLSDQVQVGGDPLVPARGTGEAASTRRGSPPPEIERGVIPDPITFGFVLADIWQTRLVGIDIEQDLSEWLTYMQAHRPDDLAKGLVRHDDWLHAIGTDLSDDNKDLTFALGSCQYPAGLLDKPVALASLGLLAKGLDKDQCEARFVIFAGDQIYADATAGLLDPSRSDELYDQPHDVALRMPAMRKVLARVPVYMLLDDHEIRDNWEPAAAKTPCAIATPDDQALRNGVAAYLRYQRMRDRGDPRRVIDFQVSNGCAEFYFLDARTRRELRSSLTLNSARIISPQQLRELGEWLRKYKDKPKFIVTASLFLPRRLAVAQNANDAAHNDAWDGYSASIADVLQVIITSKAKNIVFLSGDEHHSMLVETLLKDGSGSSIKITSVHSSGLYAPLPFANGDPRDLVSPDIFDFESLTATGITRWTATSETRFAPGDGYAHLQLHRTGGSWSLTVDFKKSNSPSSPVTVSLA